MQRYDCGNGKGPAALTAQIKKSTTIKELISTHHAHETHLNHIHLSACWTSLARQSRQILAEPGWLQRNAEALEPLVQHTIRAAMKGCFGARAFANVAYGAAGVWKSVGVGKSVGFTSSLCELFEAIAKVAKQRLDQFNGQDFASTAWAFATVGQKDDQLFKALARMAERRLDQFNAQDLANMAWAFATAGQRDGQLFKTLAKMAERCLDQFNAQNLANTAWAFVKAGQ